MIGVLECGIESLIVVRTHGMAGFAAEREQCRVELMTFVSQAWDGLCGEGDDCTAPHKPCTEQDAEHETEGEDPERE